MGCGTCWAVLCDELFVYVGSENTQCLQLFGKNGNLVYLLKDFSNMIACALPHLLRTGSRLCGEHFCALSPHSPPLALSSYFWPRPVRRLVFSPSGSSAISNVLISSLSWGWDHKFLFVVRHVKRRFSLFCWLAVGLVSLLENTKWLCCGLMLWACSNNKVWGTARWKKQTSCWYLWTTSWIKSHYILWFAAIGEK